MYMVVCKNGDVYGPFNTEEKAIYWAKNVAPLGIHINGWVVRQPIAYELI